MKVLRSSIYNLHFTLREKIINFLMSFLNAYVRPLIKYTSLIWNLSKQRHVAQLMNEYGTIFTRRLDGLNIIVRLQEIGSLFFLQKETYLDPSLAQTLLLN